MAGKRKPRIFWAQYPPDHIDDAFKKTYPGIVFEWDTHPTLGEWENELLWILNDKFDLNIKGAKESRDIQKKVRSWVDRLIEKPDLELYSKDLAKALRSFYLKINTVPIDIQRGEKAKQIPYLHIEFQPRLKGKDVTPFWLFCLAMTISRFGMESLGRCDVCGNYFIDIRHRGMKRCSPQCTSLASTSKLSSLGKQGNNPPQIKGKGRKK